VFGCLIALVMGLVSHDVWALGFSASRISGPGFTARNVVFSGNGYHASGPMYVLIGRLEIFGKVLHHSRLDCTESQWNASRFTCKGRLSFAGHIYSINLYYLFRSHKLNLVLKSHGQQIQLDADLASNWHGQMKFGGIELKLLGSQMPDLPVRMTSGMLGGQVMISGRGKQVSKLDGRLLISALAFSDPGGNHAADNQYAEVSFGISRGQSGLVWRSRIYWKNGEVYFKPVYLRQTGDTLDAKGRYAKGQWQLDSASLFLPQTGTLSVSGQIQLFPLDLKQVDIHSSGIDLKNAWAQFIIPFLPSGSLLSDSTATGHLDLMMHVQEGSPVELHAKLENASLLNSARNFAFNGISVDFPWRADRSELAFFHIDSGHWAKLPFGSIDVPLVTKGMSFSVKKSVIPVLDGQLILRNAKGMKKKNTWQWSVDGVLTPVSMSEVSRIMGWPLMQGQLSGQIPLVTYANHRLDLGGVIKARVFNGDMTIAGLEVTHPFDSHALLHANFDAKRLDLGLMTRAFSFGSIEGLLDARVTSLELYDWHPIYFNARIESSAGNYRRRISQEAVRSITAIGGGGASAAIQRGFLQFFHTFGYSRLGISCLLEAGICHMRGIEDVPGGYVIIAGGGVPSLTVVGHNTNVDWQILVDRLIAATSGKMKPVIR